MKIPYAIVEDDIEALNLTLQLLNQVFDLECVGQFGNATDYLKALPKLSAKIVLMDLGLPDKSGIECIQIGRAIQPNIEYLVLTNQQSPEKVFEALAVGAVGYLLKNSDATQLATAIRAASEGGAPMSWKLSRLVIGSFRQTQTKFPHLETLTQQENVVLQDLAKGKSYDEIAKNHYIATNTVRTHVKNVYRKLEIHTRADMIYKLVTEYIPPCQCPQYNHLLTLLKLKR